MISVAMYTIRGNKTVQEKLNNKGVGNGGQNAVETPTHTVSEDGMKLVFDGH